MGRPQMYRLQTSWQLELVLNRLREEAMFVFEETERLLDRPWANSINPTEKEMIVKCLDTAAHNLSFATGYVQGLRLRLKKEKDHERPQTPSTPVERTSASIPGNPAVSLSAWRAGRKPH